jgi:alpha-L-fucosidase 2
MPTPRSSAPTKALREIFSLSLLLLAASHEPIQAHGPQPWHGLQFTTPVTSWDEAIPLGNGILGALLWGDGQPVRISLDRTDLWDLTPVPEFHSPEYSYQTMRDWHHQGRHDDLVRLYEQPYHRPAPTKIPAGRIELDLGPNISFRDSSLNLHRAAADMRFLDGSLLEVFLHARQPVGLIRFRPARGQSPHPVRPQLIAPAFGGDVIHPAQGGIGAGDLAQLGYPPPVETHGDGWQAFAQQGALGFEFAACLVWKTNGHEWIAAWSVASTAEGRNPLQRAQNRAQRALRRSFESNLKSHQSWWTAYWNQSWISLPNPTLERQWYLETYKFGAASRRGAPPITLQGPWTADDGQLPPWKGDYHHDLNTQLSYWPCYSGNRLDQGLSYLDWLWATRQNCEKWTRRFYNLPGLNVPMTADLNNNQIGGWRQYTHSATTAAWLAHHFYLHWKFSQNRRFLRYRAYPYLQQASVFLEAITHERDARGYRTLPLSSSPEVHDNRPEAWFPTITNYDLALIRWLFEATAELADELRKPRDARHWRSLLTELPDFSLGEDGRLLLADRHPLKESHRHFSHLMALHPLGLIDVANGPESQRIVEASLRDLDRHGTDGWCGYSFAWLGNLAARAYDGPRAERALEIFSSAFTLRNSFHCNGDQSGQGHSQFTYRPFTLEGNFAMAAGLQEMLLQSHRDQIELFPAIPPSWTDLEFHSLRAQGGILVSAQLQNGAVTRVVLHSEQGGPCQLRSPSSSSTLNVWLRPRQPLTLLGSDLKF